MSCLSSDRVVRFFGFCEDRDAADGFYAIAMELASRGALSQLLADQSVDLPWGTRLVLAADVCEGVAYLHSCNVRANGGWGAGWKARELFADKWGSACVARLKWMPSSKWSIGLG